MAGIDHEFIREVEASDFRTIDDTGANPAALLIWNRVRKHVGLPNLNRDDLPAYCLTHEKYHKIEPDYGCERKGA